MAAQIGVLLDVSASMKANMGDKRYRGGGKWAMSIFDVVSRLIKHDVSGSNHIFALGFGAAKWPYVFDILTTIENMSALSVPSDIESLTFTETLTAILDFLENNGAPRVRIWAEMDVLRKSMKETDAKTFLSMLRRDDLFAERFVNSYLPESCRHAEVGTKRLGKELAYRFWGFIRGTSWRESATADGVENVVEQGIALLPRKEVVKICPGAVMSVHKAQELLHGSVGQMDLTYTRVEALMDLVEPYIYGNTPLGKALKAALEFFEKDKFKNFNKLLFILSDGQPTDTNIPPVQRLSALGVKTICCLISSLSGVEPKSLYSFARLSWSKSAKFMFNMSSPIVSQLIPRTIFLKRGWNIDIENNETRLFVQVNHPDNIADVCELARDVVCCQDALSDLLSSIALDLYINKANQGFHPKNQKGGTCYANASAAVLHLSMVRIVGREGGVPDFFALRDEMILKYGIHGADTYKVLKEICPKYRLHCKNVNVIGAMQAIVSKRPVLARFRLTDDEWDIFASFYHTTPRGTLTKSVLSIDTGVSNRSGHAVVLTSFDSQGLRLMNSWGSKWADGGFFRVADADVLDLEFFDVSWETSDLTQSEIDAYERYGSEIAKQLVSKLKGLQKAIYECPMCYMKSPLTEFKGHALATICPKCKTKFTIQDKGDNLALNMYLLSLAVPRKAEPKP